MSDLSTLTQGSALPNITTNQSQTTTTPQFYTDYLQNLASQGSGALSGAQFAGPTALQTQAFGSVPQLAGSGTYQPYLTQAGGALTTAAGSNPLSAANPYLAAATNNPAQQAAGYMSPYTNQVVGALGALNTQNINQNLLPALDAGSVSSGQYGSQRAQNAKALGVTQANLGTQAQQAEALQSGYNTALQTALGENQINLGAGQAAGQLTNSGAFNQIQAGQALGGLGQTAQNTGLNYLNALSTLGGQQQSINQAQNLFPFQALSDYGSLLQGQQIPTSVNQTYTGPGQQGNYQLSPLSQIGSIGSLIGGLTSGNNNTALGSLGSLVGSGLSNLGSGIGNFVSSIFGP